MTSKEKANDLYDYFFDPEELNINKAHNKAKQYVLIVVDEVIEALDRYSFDSPLYRYWQEVKKEIEKM